MVEIICYSSLSGGETKRDTLSNLQSLSLSNCNLDDTLISSLSSHLGAAAVPRLVELVLTDNPKLTSAALKDFITMATGMIFSCFWKN